jgi:hypothetical protein
MCAPFVRPGWPHSCHCGCWGGEAGRYFHRLPSAEEEKRRLEEYRRQLQEEIAEVDRRLRDLKSE